jgi:hypothetical protein
MQARHGAKAVFEKDGLLDDLKKVLAERNLKAEMDVHLGQEAAQPLPGRGCADVMLDRGGYRGHLPINHVGHQVLSTDQRESGILVNVQ